MKLGEILIQKKLITEEQLQSALEEQRASHDFLGEIILKHKWVTEVQLLRALSEQFDLEYVSLDFEEIDWAVPAAYASAMQGDKPAMPFQQGVDFIKVAISNPLEMWGVSQVESRARGRQVQTVLATASSIRRAIEEFRRRAIHAPPS